MSYKCFFPFRHNSSSLIRHTLWLVAYCIFLIMHHRVIPSLCIVRKCTVYAHLSPTLKSVVKYVANDSDRRHPSSRSWLAVPQELDKHLFQCIISGPEQYWFSTLLKTYRLMRKLTTWHISSCLHILPSLQSQKDNGSVSSLPGQHLN